MTLELDCCLNNECNYWCRKEALSSRLNEMLILHKRSLCVKFDHTHNPAVPCKRTNIFFVAKISHNLTSNKSLNVSDTFSKSKLPSPLS